MGWGGGVATPSLHDVWACRCAGRGHTLTQKFFLNFWELTLPGRGLNICCKIFLGKIFFEKRGIYLNGYEKQSG